MTGYNGQFVTIVPEKKLVVVRLGLSRLPRAWDQTAFVAEVITAIRDSPSDTRNWPGCGHRAVGAWRIARVS